MYLQFPYKALQYHALSPLYRVSQKKLARSVYANISSKSSHLEITKGSFEIYWTSAFQNCPYFWILTQ